MSNRFISTNATALVAFLQTTGLDPQARTAAPWNGSSDLPHPGVTRHGQPMLSVLSSLSDRALHRAAVATGLVDPRGREGAEHARAARSWYRALPRLRAAKAAAEAAQDHGEVAEMALQAASAEEMLREYVVGAER